MQTPKACIDVMLGAIAITSGARTLETYVEDMIQRGQSADRITEVRKALNPYAEHFLSHSKEYVKNPPVKK